MTTPPPIPPSPPTHVRLTDAERERWATLVDERLVTEGQLAKAGKLKQPTISKLLRGHRCVVRWEAYVAIRERVEREYARQLWLTGGGS